MKHKLADIRHGTKSPLMAAIASWGQAHGETMYSVSRRLGVTAGYLYQLHTGRRQTLYVSPRAIQAFAEVLGVSIAVTQVLAGQITATDLHHGGAADDVIGQDRDEFVKTALREVRAAKLGREAEVAILALCAA